MTGAVLIRSMDPQDVTAVADLIGRSFHGSLASSWPAAAIQDFERYIDVSSLKRRIESHHQHWVAEKDGIIVGILELRHGRQITLFFVDKRFRSAGVGRRLLHVAERSACFAFTRACRLFRCIFVLDSIRRGSRRQGTACCSRRLNESRAIRRPAVRRRILPHATATSASSLRAIHPFASAR